MKIFGMESRKFALWLVVICVAAAVITGLALVFSGLPQSIRNGEEWPRVRYTEGEGIQINESRSFPTEGLEGIEISLSFEDAVISVSPENSGMISVHYSGSVKTGGDGRDVLSAEIGSGRLAVRSDWTGHPFRFARMKLEMIVPADWSGHMGFSGASGNLMLSGLDLKTLDARLASGNMTVEDLQSEVLMLKNASGNIEGTNIGSGSARVSAASGNLRLDDIFVRDVLELSTASGSIIIAGATAGDVRGHAVSGDVILNDVSGNLEVKNSSGSVEAVFAAPGDRIDISNTSGDILVALPGEAEFTLSARTASGRIRSDFPVSVSGSMNGRRLEGDTGNGGGIQMNLSSSSGDINIEKR